MRAVRSSLVVEAPPALDQHARLSATAEPFAIEKLVAQLAVEGFAVAVHAAFDLHLEAYPRDDLTLSQGALLMRDSRRPEVRDIRNVREVHAEVFVAASGRFLATAHS